MNLKSLSDAKLIESTLESVDTETTATTNVVRHFVELFERDIYLARGYSSMFLMAVKVFKYDKASAQRRVNAMELARAVPLVLEKIESGELCLDSASSIQSFLNMERGKRKPYSSEQKAELVHLCSGLSTRDVQIELNSRNPELDFKESKKWVTKDRMQITYTTRVSTEEKLTRIKELRSHTNPYMTREELIDYMADLVLEKIDPAFKDARIEKRKKLDVAILVPAPEPQTPFQIREEIINDIGEVQLAIDFDDVENVTVSNNSVPAPALKRSRYLTASARHQVRATNRNQGCGFTDSTTGQRCGSQHQTQFDHIIEYSQGGYNDASNLQMFCAKHNRFRWRQRSRFFVRADAANYR